MPFNKRIWIAGTLICILYWFTWHGYQDNVYTQFKTDIALRHAIDYGLLVAVFAVGWLGLTKHHQKWLLALWIVCYTIVLATLAVFGLIDITTSVLKNASFRDLLTGLRYFFNSPVPYGVLLFFGRRVHRHNAFSEES